jgi:hypothetical protein
MSRMQFVLTLLAGGFCLAFLASSLTSAPERAWDPRETKSPLFTKQPNTPENRDGHLGADSTISRWRRARTARPLSEAPSTTGEPQGVRLSLVSFVNASSTLPQCPRIIPLFGSVLGDSTKGAMNCSTNLVVAPAGSTCSVNTSASTSDRYMCSSINQAAAYCSTGPNGTSDGSNGPEICSTQGGASGGPGGDGNGSVVCSTDFKDCSTQGNVSNSPATVCSTTAGQHQACSTGNESNATSTCSTGNGAAAGQNNCSVTSDSTRKYGNKCS